MADIDVALEHVGEFTEHIAPKESGNHSISTQLLMDVEQEIATRMQIAGDTAAALLYDIVDGSPSAINRFVEHHAGVFLRRDFETVKEASEVTAVLIRHALIVGVIAGRRTPGRGL
jgi:hypothetical protein